jgi:hypothetical protein
MGDAHNILIGEPLRTTPLWIHRCMCGNSIKFEREYDMKLCSTLFCLLTGSSDGFLRTRQLNLGSKNDE